MNWYKTASKRIICNGCGTQFVIGDLESHQDLSQHAKRKGWSFYKEEILCPKCVSKIHPSELLMREILK